MLNKSRDINPLHTIAECATWPQAKLVAICLDFLPYINGKRRIYIYKVVRLMGNLSADSCPVRIGGTVGARPSGKLVPAHVLLLRSIARDSGHRTSPTPT